jgi:hypothetical protein
MSVDEMEAVSVCDESVWMRESEEMAVGRIVLICLVSLGGGTLFREVEVSPQFV